MHIHCRNNFCYLRLYLLQLGSDCGPFLNIDFEKTMKMQVHQMRTTVCLFIASFISFHVFIISPHWSADTRMVWKNISLISFKRDSHFYIMNTNLSACSEICFDIFSISLETSDFVGVSWKKEFSIRFSIFFCFLFSLFLPVICTSISFCFFIVNSIFVSFRSHFEVLSDITWTTCS